LLYRRFKSEGELNKKQAQGGRMAFEGAASRGFLVVAEPDKADGPHHRKVGERRSPSRAVAARASPAETFPANLKARRIELGLTQQMIADALGMSKVSVWKWECGQTMPSHANLLRLAETLKTTPQRLLFGEDQSSTSDVNAGAVPLHETIGEAKRRIAAVAGTQPDKVTISVEY
jgi:transcriptional regulator with XRE-family HTH domain